MLPAAIVAGGVALHGPVDLVQLMQGEAKHLEDHDGFLPLKGPRTRSKAALRRTALPERSHACPLTGSKDRPLGYDFSGQIS